MTERLTKDALDEWRSHPVTEWLLSVLRRGAELNRASLQARLWADGSCNPADLAKTKAQIELIEDLTETNEDEWNDWATALEHERHSPA